MKKQMTIAAVLAAMTLAACSQKPAQSNQSFGASVPAQTITVQQALSARDDSYVTLEGHILSQVDDDEYLFSDNSGQIRVEIDQHIWRGQNVSSQNKVRLYGEIDKEWNKTELKVRELTILK